jgi:HK97 family phage portal protein
MGFFTSLFKKSVKAAGEIRDSRSLAEALAWLFGFGQSSSGIEINQDTAMRCATAYSCGKVLEEDVAKLPCKLFKRAQQGKVPAIDHPLYDLLHVAPCEWLDSFNFRSLMMNWCIWRGNAYAYINRVGGEVREIIPIHPDYVTPNLSSNYELTYHVSDDNGSKDLPRDQIFHMMGQTLNGYKGVSVITFARETIGSSLAAEKYGALTFKNGAKMSGIIELPGRLKDKPSMERLRDGFDNFVNGENTGKTAVLEDGGKYNKVSMSNEDAQYIETRKFDAEEVCRWFRMPQHKVQILEHATFSNIEHQSLEYVTDTLLPWLCRWEYPIMTRLLTREERKEYSPEIVVEGLLRGDQKSRYDSYAIGINWGILNPNECREKENLNAREGGDVYLRPLNMQPSNEPDKDNQNGQSKIDQSHQSAQSQSA